MASYSDSSRTVQESKFNQNNQDGCHSVFYFPDWLSDGFHISSASACTAFWKLKVHFGGTRLVFHVEEEKNEDS